MNSEVKRSTYVWVGAAIILLAVVLILLWVNLPADNIAFNEQENREMMEEYIAELLNEKYSKYYTVNSVVSEDWRYEIDGSKLDAFTFTTMNFTLPFKDPKEDSYISDLKQQIDAETDSAKKQVLQNEYDTLVEEYNQPMEANFSFKLTADTDKGNIIPETVRRVLEQDLAPGEVMYTPIEEVFEALP